MAGITPQVSTSSFKPLSLQEIMMVPMAKQKMEDELLDEISKFAGMSADVLSVDSEKANSIINDYKTRASSLADKILEGGVDRSQFHDLRKLKGDVTNEQSNGFLSSAMSNKKSAAKYINDLATDKVRQAGWSPQQAKVWAQTQVDQFGGTDGGDGTFNSFSGRELAMKVDEDKFIEDAIDSVSEHVSQTAMQAVRIGGLPAFQKAFQEGKVDSKDYNRIMDAVLSKSMNNPDLLASIQQQSFFTGEENPLDLGHFRYSKDKEGNTVREFVAGKSRYGRKAAGYGRAANYRNIDIDTRFLKDDVAFQMRKMGMEEKQALDLISFEKGEMNELTPDTIETIQKNLDLYGVESKQLLSQANNRLKELMATGMDEATAKSDQKYKRLYNSYSQSNIGYMNSKSRLDNMYSKVESKLSDDTRTILELGDMMYKYGGDAIKALKEEFGKSVPKDWLSKGYGRKEKDQAERMLADAMGIDMSKSGRSRGDFSAIPYMIRDAKEERTKFSQKYLEANPQAEHFTIINASSTGKYSSKYGAWQDLKSKKFNIKSSNLAYGKGPLSESPEFAELGESKEGFDYQVSPTDGVDDLGSYFNNVIITNKETGAQASFQIKDNLSAGMLSEMAKDLQTGDYQQRKLGEQLEANVNFMPAIKKSGMLWQDRGFMRITIKKGVERDDVEYVKTDDGYYNVFIGGIPVELNGRTDLAGEKEVALALNNEVKEINKYRLSQQNKK